MPSGGKRPGSGRKAVSPGEKRVQMMLTIAPETRDKIKALAEAQDMPPGKLIDKVIDAMIILKK